MDERAVACAHTRAGFSAYLDGALDGHSMAQLAAHLRACDGCATEFEAWRTMQTALAAIGPASLPTELQAQLRDALATEIGTGRHLSPWRRAGAFWRQTLVPVGLRLGAGLAATVILLGSGALILSTALPVQANDDAMANLKAPKYLYSQASQPIVGSGAGGTVLVDAKIDARGKVYDFDVMEGPSDPATRLRLEANLLGSVFQPATVFGVPVPGHVMMTYTAVSAGS